MDSTGAFQKEPNMSLLLDADVQALNDVYECVQLYYASTRMIKKRCHIKFPTLAPAGALFLR